LRTAKVRCQKPPEGVAMSGTRGISRPVRRSQTLHSSVVRERETTSPTNRMGRPTNVHAMLSPVAMTVTRKEK